MSARLRLPARPRLRASLDLLTASLGALSVAAGALAADAAPASGKGAPPTAPPGALPAAPASCEPPPQAPPRDPVCAQAETSHGLPTSVVLTYPQTVVPAVASRCVGLAAGGATQAFAGVSAGPSGRTVVLELSPGETMPAAVRCPSIGGPVMLGVIAATATEPALLADPAVPATAVQAAGAAGSGSQPGLHSWGQNLHLELGAGYRSDREEQPVPLRGLAANVTELVAGEGADAALTATGEVETWGGCLYGQCGIGHVLGAGLVTPTVVLTGVRQIAAGGADVVALMDNGTVDVWGANLAGEAGNGTSSNGGEGPGASIPAPQPVPGLSNVTHVYGGGSIFAVRADGSVVAWGRNHHGELGLGFSSYQVLRPTPVPGLHAPAQIAVGNQASFEDHTLALMPSGQVLAAGSNNLGQDGNGTTTASVSFAPVPGLPPVAEVAASGRNSLARTVAGQAYSWGANRSGELGNGNTSGPDKCAPMEGRLLRTRLVACSTRPVLLPLAGASRIGLGLGFGGVVSGGRLAEWGDGSTGALADGSERDELTPTFVPGLSGVSMTAFGYQHAIAFGNLEPAPAPWLTATAGNGAIALSWNGTATEPWQLEWREETPGAPRSGQTALAPSAHSYTIAGLTPGRWEVYVDSRFAWPHPRVAEVVVP